MRVRDIMSSPVVTVRPDDRIKDAATLLVRHKINAVPVVTSGDRLVGIIAEADLIALESAPDPRLHARIQPARDDQRTPRLVSELMTTEVVCLHPDNDVAVAALLMRKRGMRSIPVVADHRVVGIVARRDLITVLAREDRDIQAELQDQFSQADMLLPYQVAVRDGVAILTGPTDQHTRDLATRLARTVPGVLAVGFTDLRAAPRPEHATRPA